MQFFNSLREFDKFAPKYTNEFVRTYLEYLNEDIVAELTSLNYTPNRDELTMLLCKIAEKDLKRNREMLYEQGIR